MATPKNCADAQKWEVLFDVPKMVWYTKESFRAKNARIYIIIRAKNAIFHKNVRAKNCADAQKWEVVSIRSSEYTILQSECKFATMKDGEISEKRRTYK